MRAPRFLAARSASRGFTLIELLTVIAIIGILAAILIPTVARVRAKATDAQCRSGLRQWGTAIQLYLGDNKGRMPGPCYSFVLPQQSSDHIVTYLAPYMGLVPASGKPIPANFICRGWTGATPDLTAPVYLIQNIPLPTNPAKTLKPFGVANNAAGAPPFYQQLSSQVEPSRSAILGEVDKLVTDAGTAAVASSFGSRVPEQPVHGETRNVLYLDFHVASVAVGR